MTGAVQRLCHELWHIRCGGPEDPHVSLPDVLRQGVVQHLPRDGGVVRDSGDGRACTADLETDMANALLQTAKGQSSEPLASEKKASMSKYASSSALPLIHKALTHAALSCKKQQQMKLPFGTSRRGDGYGVTTEQRTNQEH